MDHSHHDAAMDHSQHDTSMDHSRHDGHDGHDGHGGDDAHSHGHAMVFHACVNAEILFPGWVTTNAWEMLGSCAVIFIAGVLYEGLKYYREALHSRATSSPGDSTVNITKTECGANGSCGGTAVVKYSMLSSGHMVQTGLHIIQSSASYILMLVFMTYNVYLCLALVLGLGLGYFCFGWRKASVVDVTEHCQ